MKTRMKARHTSPKPIVRPPNCTRSGLDRRSRAWRDLVGPGYSVGPSGRVIDAAVRADKSGYAA